MLTPGGSVDWIMRLFIRPRKTGAAQSFAVLLPFLLAASLLPGQSPDWPKLNQEAMRHFQALVQLDTTNPPGNETRVVEYVKKVLEAEGIAVTVAAKDPARANLIARLKGNGSKRPLLIMGHSDTVRVDAEIGWCDIHGLGVVKTACVV